MPTADITREIEDLRIQIRHHDELYYQHAKPEISDQEYDALLRRLIELEKDHPELATPDSPTHRVGGQPIEGFVSVRHAVRMMSIDNTYSEDEVRDFDTRVRKLFKEAGVRDSFAYTCEPKIDGVSLSVRYENGLLKLAATRGDGTTGDDVTHNVKTIRNVPLRLKSAEAKGAKTESKKKTAETSLFAQSSTGSHSFPSVLEIRGEVFISRAQFVKINQQQEEAGEEPYANPRNTAAGSLKQLDPTITSARKLEFLPHGQGEVVGRSFATYHEWMDFLGQIGFRTNPHFRCCENIEGVLDYIRTFAENRKSLPYDTDGVVVKIDRFDQRDVLGATSKAPRWCIAFKYQPEQATTQIKDVRLQVGKTGVITPVADFEPPVFISGTNVYRASLHNFDEIARKDIHLRDYVIVEKAGEVIPYVVGVSKDKQRPDDAKPIARPKACPSCKSKDLEHDGGFVRCINPDCPAQVAEKLRFWTGRNQMDIAEIGPAVIEALLKSGLVKSIADLYRLRLEDVKTLVVSEYERTDEDADAALPLAEKEAAKSVKVTIGGKRGGNIIAGIAASKDRGLARVLAGLGILDIGNRTAQLIAQHFVSLEKLRNASLADILLAPEMGGGVLKDIEKLQERYPDCAKLTIEQILGSAPIPAATESNIKALPARRAHEKSPSELIQQLRGRGVAARSLYDFLHSDAGRKVFDDLASLAIKLNEDVAVRAGPQPLAGKTVVITGTLSKDRNHFKALIESLGGKTTDSVSKNTSFVLAGEEAGSKRDKARKLNVDVIDEKEFLKRIGQE